MIFRGVQYDDEGARLLRTLGRRWHETDDPDEKEQILSEAEVVHAFHENFPGLCVRDVEEAA